MIKMTTPVMIVNIGIQKGKKNEKVKRRFDVILKLVYINIDRFRFIRKFTYEKFLIFRLPGTFKIAFYYMSVEGWQY